MRIFVGRACCISPSVLRGKPCILWFSTGPSLIRLWRIFSIQNHITICLSPFLLYYLGKLVRYEKCGKDEENIDSDRSNFTVTGVADLFHDKYKSFYSEIFQSCKKCIDHMSRDLLNFEDVLKSVFCIFICY